MAEHETDGKMDKRVSIPLDPETAMKALLQVDPDAPPGPPRTCYVCRALITRDRGGELVRVAQEPDLVWVHPACKGSPLADK